MKYITSFIAGILALDFLAFTAWIISGQLPVDSFYFGVITKTLLTLII